MKLDRDFLTSPTGQLLLVAAVLLLGVLAVRWQHRPRSGVAVPAVRPAPTVPLPKILTRDGARFARPAAAPQPVSANPAAAATATPSSTNRPTPLVLVSSPAEVSPPAPAPYAPYGRLIACETVIALESNRLDTPIVGLVTENVWHDGQLVLPAGAEVHGRASLDRARERIAAQTSWRIVWRTPGKDNGTELPLEGVALEREFDPVTNTRGEYDGSAGLRGQIVRTSDDRELKLFAATFLATATAAFQETRPTVGLLGESSVPAATARNAALAGTSAILRDYAQQLRDAIARDGFYLRVPAGHAFYLYVTQTLDRSNSRRAPIVARSVAPIQP